MPDKSRKQESPNEPPGKPKVPPTALEAERAEQERVQAAVDAGEAERVSLIKEIKP
jgi:hypothetical protein